jgi:hypothetical protein
MFRKILAALAFERASDDVQLHRSVSARFSVALMLSR